MRRIHSKSGLVLASVIGVTSLFGLAACDTGTDTTTTTTEVPVTPETPTATAPGTGTTDPTAPATTATTGQDATVAEIASTSESFQTLSRMIEAAGLDQTLEGAGPYTVFAPTDAAFSQLSQDTVNQLLEPQNREQLRRVLSYHVIPGEVTSTQLTPGEVNTVEGQPVTVEVDQATQAVRVNDATVVQPNIQASNGVLHAVDRVLLPEDINIQ